MRICRSKIPYVLRQARDLTMLRRRGIIYSISILFRPMLVVSRREVCPMLLCAIGIASTISAMSLCKRARRSLARAGCGFVATIVGTWVFVPRVMQAIRFLRGLPHYSLSTCGSMPIISTIAIVATIIYSICGTLLIGVWSKADISSDNYALSCVSTTSL